MELFQILIEDCVKVLVTRVHVSFFFANLNVGPLSHLFVSWASSFREICAIGLAGREKLTDHLSFPTH